MTISRFLYTYTYTNNYAYIYKYVYMYMYTYNFLFMYARETGSRDAYSDESFLYLVQFFARNPNMTLPGHSSEQQMQNKCKT